MCHLGLAFYVRRGEIWTFVLNWQKNLWPIFKAKKNDPADFSAEQIGFQLKMRNKGLLKRDQ